MFHFIEIEIAHEKQRDSLNKIKKVSQEIGVPQKVFSDVKIEPKNINTANMPAYYTSISTDSPRYYSTSTWR
jgi:hypothetical protein